MEKVIGLVTTYKGTEHKYLNGYKVRIVAVYKNADKPGVDVDSDCYRLEDDRDIARSGGVGVYDRVEVQPWIEQESRFSFVSSDPRSIDLECFSK